MAKKILIVEDEKVLLDLLEKRMKKEGYDVAVAHDGEEGMEKIREYGPDLILLDIVMPKKDGMQVMEELSADPELKKIPVVIISNSGQPVEIDRIKKLGARDWLVKTEFDPKEVVDIVIAQIGR
jgi:DNA-binding response OmpR family regulator